MNKKSFFAYTSGFTRGILFLSCFPASSFTELAAELPDKPIREQVSKWVSEDYSYLETLYKHLHTHPELSFQEKKTSERLAAELRSAGLDVTTDIGGYGVVGVFRNGEGPTILLRTDLDALPVREQTGLPYASSAQTTDDRGENVPVMHACGHDVHMTVLVGAARALTSFRDRWQGTLVMIGQPAEERGAGARAMLADGLYERFPYPDYAFAFHVQPDLPVRTIGYVSGYALANVDSMDIIVKGVGGHGAYPHSARDPVVLAAQIVLALQTIVSREIEPIEPAVVTVGSIHGGTKHNIIPDQVHLQLTLRSYSDTVREQIISAIKRITQGHAQAAGLPPELYPEIIIKKEYTPALYNDPKLVERLVGALEPWVGGENLHKGKPVMGGEDFSRYGRTEPRVPIAMMRIGTVSMADIERSRQTGRELPSLHSPFFAPVPEPSIKTGVTAMVAVVLELAPSQK